MPQGSADVTSFSHVPTEYVVTESYMSEPIVIDCSKNDMAVETIEQHYFTVAQDRKSDLLDHLLEREVPNRP